jgi:hypothetical protein
MAAMLFGVAKVTPQVIRRRPKEPLEAHMTHQSLS